MSSKYDDVKILNEKKNIFPKVEWTPLNSDDFNGDSRTGGYLIEYREITDYLIPEQSSPRVELRGPKKSSVILEDLVRITHKHHFKT